MRMGADVGDDGPTLPETSRLANKRPGNKGWDGAGNRFLLTVIRRNPLCRHLGLEAPTRKTEREEVSDV